MATKRQQKRRACTGKYRYRIEAWAWKHVRELVEKGHDASADRLTVYRCPWSTRKSPHWHVGHRLVKPKGGQG